MPEGNGLSDLVHRAAIGLGSNLPGLRGGGPEENIRLGILGVASLGEVVAVSALHTTEPVGVVEQPQFQNAALTLHTALEPLPLMRALLEVERGLGRDRTRGVPKGPRTLDLDLLLYDDVVMTSAELTLPHPAMHERRFALLPLAEIAPEWRHPVLGQTVAELLRRLGPER